jgi:RNA polymerase sigma-70 factor, ECF subfamily
VNALSTAELVVRAQRGDDRCFAELCERHMRAAFATALAVLGDVAEAEDVAQESMVTAHEKLTSCRDPARFSGWLIQIARNRALNDLAKRRVRGAYAARETAAVRPASFMPNADPELRARMLGALAALPEVQREIVLLHDLDGWTHGELAAALGISEVMSRQHLFNARRALRALLEPDAPKEVYRGR